MAVVLHFPSSQAASEIVRVSVAADGRLVLAPEAAVVSVELAAVVAWLTKSSPEHELPAAVVDVEGLVASVGNREESGLAAALRTRHQVHDRGARRVSRLHTTSEASSNICAGKSW